MTELLAPAGDMNGALAAINSGADAVYLGLKSFSARASAENFDCDMLRRLCEYAHVLGVKIYVAVNTLVKQSELTDFIGEVVAAHNAGADALIIQDIFLGKYLKEVYPQLHLHLSTQAGVNNVYGARMAKRFGFERVILARETALKDIAEIAKVIETEVFVQGALCTCFSGQCYLSSFAGGNSGNRGRCKQPCRKQYAIDRQGYTEKAYALSLSDLSVGTDITKLIDAGVYSFKIEGRMRRPEYIAAAVKYYRGLIDGNDAGGGLSALKRTYNRGNYTKGLAFGQDKSFISRSVQGHLGEFCGNVEVVNGKYVCHSTMHCVQGDAFKVLRGGRELCGAVFGGVTRGGFFVNSQTRLINGDKIFITTDVRLNERLLSGRKLKKISVSLKIACGSAMSVAIDGKEYVSEFIPAPAVNRGLMEEDVLKCFCKVDGYPFEPEFTDISVIGEPFVPVSALNSLRRHAYSEHFKMLSCNSNETIGSILPLPIKRRCGKNSLTAIISGEFGGVGADIGILKPEDYRTVDIGAFGSFKGKKYLYLPPFFSGDDICGISDVLKEFDGVYCDGYWAWELCLESGTKLFAGCGFNLSNDVALSMLDSEYVALSKELTLNECQPLFSDNTFYLSAGDIKVMDIIYCPFEKSCKSCDKRLSYRLTDESGRRFSLRRYSASSCRFELFNCDRLICMQQQTGRLLDCSLGDARMIGDAMAANDGEKLRKLFKNYTAGHSKNPVH